MSEKKFTVRFDPSAPPEPRGGVSNFIGWRRLEDMLRRAGEFTPSETLTHFVMDDHGITYFVERKDAAR